MRRVMLAGASALVLLGGAGYVTADVYDVVPGVLTRDREALPATGPDTSDDAAPSLLPTPSAPGAPREASDAPVPSRDELAAAVAGASDDPALRRGLGVSIRDGVTGEELWSRAADVPRAPASTAKLLAAFAVADTLDLAERVPTSVVAAPGSRDLVLVVRGDMLLAPGRGDADAVAGRAGLADLARRVARTLVADGRTDVTLRLDTSFAPGPRVPPTWNPNDVRDGFAGPVVMTGLTTTRATPVRPAPTRPEDVVARALVQRLRAEGVTARLRPTSTWSRPAPDDAVALGTVESATYGELLGLALAESDNSLAESLVRQAAASLGRPTTGADANADLVRARLEAADVPTSGLRLKDASGLSPGQAVAPATLSAVLGLAVRGEPAQLRGVVAGLPVSGLSGTLLHRFSSDATRDVRGLPRAKTGTLRAGSSLAGTTVDADGRPLTFVVQVDGFPRTYDGTLRARAAMDRVVAAVTRCGCDDAAG
ncbi:D-alanyl-D-alanine carboxypeptidase [Arthrobacter sp. NEB 688]|uniref:D-alanyl-D-alanine carboxypeptidase/D-alanyl-D-alanine-endopeptidase n=1 Tax=Arthrobacter sp. NEB 688 TaxID=904039 RepID=UPI00156418B0|nr:D-alanyl-D-alanine carboxypeptidase [Arthrobacter sp. NEB 688]QKE83663.1 D-alanyl-D-alanine carboxypeptidase/D-alanyl-D-alanine-endopeptidase [Arthrobacter sp. NEB 688]